MKRDSGFTLIELMIVIAVIGILMAIAIPNYSEYVTRSRITRATAALSDMRVRMEQFFQDNRVYPTACTAAPAATEIALPPAADNPDFAFTCALAANTFTITATGQGKMDGFVYTVNQSNVKGTTLSAAAGKASAGWSGTGSACWVISKGGGC
jgi:type IV pilus assembly protein PilE